MNQETNIDASGVAAPGPGTQLRQVREARGMSIAEVAASLKMSPRQIEAVENEDFSRLAGATFVRGFIRNYARLLKTDPAPLLALVAATAAIPPVVLDVPGGSRVRMPAGNERHGRFSLVAGFLAVALLAVAIALYFDVVDIGAHFGRLMERTGDVAVRPPSAGAVQSVVQPAPQSLNPSAPSSVPTPPADGSPVSVANEPAPGQGASRPGLRQLVFSFDGSSWVEVKDGKGRTLFSQLSPKGVTHRVEGSPPFQVVVGNAGNVRLAYDEQPIDLRPHTRVEVARLTLE